MSAARQEALGAVPAAAPAGARRRGLRRVAVAAVVVALAAAGVSAVSRAGGTGGSGDTAAPAVQTTTADVRRTSLVTRERVDGTLGFADSGRKLTSALSGVVTAMAAEGEVVGRGGVLYRVGGQPVVLLFGKEPAWRDLGPGVKGADVRQLKDSLIALGHATSAALGTDSEYDSATTAAVKRLQKKLGVSQTGSLPLGQVVFLPDAVRVGAHEAQVGSSVEPGAEVFATSSTQRVVTVDLNAAKQGLVKVGDAVDVRLPNGKTTTGKVTAIDKVAKTSGGEDGGDAKTTLGITIVLDDPAVAGDLDQAPVKVGITTARADNVLAVPVNALLAVGSGQYAVEVDRGGTRRVVRVETGLFSDGENLVEITSSELREGDKVVVPV